jgi:hypothetical protein
LTEDLLELPHLSYLDNFRRDYQGCRNPNERIKLQETLTKVSSLLAKSQGDISSLKADGGLQYEKYTNLDLGHFRVTQGLRVSCHVENKQLILHRYGKEPEVNTHPE